METTLSDRAAIPPGEPLLVGPYMASRPLATDRPALLVSVWCPYCQAGHMHEFPKAPTSIRQVLRVPAACNRGPWEGGWYWVGGDPRSTRDARTAGRVARAAGDWDAARPKAEV